MDARCACARLCLRVGARERPGARDVGGVPVLGASSVHQQQLAWDQLLVVVHVVERDGLVARSDDARVGKPLGAAQPALVLERGRQRRLGHAAQGKDATRRHRLSAPRPNKPARGSVYVCRACPGSGIGRAKQMRSSGK
eukprot:754873-Pleurochrysis_carterae.AAC.1